MPLDFSQCGKNGALKNMYMSSPDTRECVVQVGGNNAVSSSNRCKMYRNDTLRWL